VQICCVRWKSEAFGFRGASPPNPPLGALPPGPPLGLRSQTPVIGSRSRSRHVPPKTKFLDPPPAGLTFNLTHATPLTTGPKFADPSGCRQSLFSEVYGYYTNQYNKQNLRCDCASYHMLVFSLQRNGIFNLLKPHPFSCLLYRNTSFETQE